MLSAFFNLVTAPRARCAWMLGLALLAPACGNNKDDDDRPRKSRGAPAAEPPAPATVAPVQADPPQEPAQPAQPAPPPQGAAPAQPAQPGQPGQAQPAQPGQAQPKKKGDTPLPIPTQYVPKQLQPLIPKVPAGLPIPQ